MPRNAKALSLVGLALSQLPDCIDKAKVGAPQEACVGLHARTDCTCLCVYAERRSWQLSVCLDVAKVGVRATLRPWCGIACKEGLHTFLCR